MEEYLYWYTYKKEMMVESTFSSGNVHEVVDVNSYLYKNMVMDAMGKNQGGTGECTFIDETPNANVTRFFLSFKILR